MIDYEKMSPEVRRKLEEIVEAENVSNAAEDLEKHGIDESLEPPHPPELVVIPESTEEVSAIMELAYKERIPVTPQGSRTGLSAGSHSVYGGVALSLEIDRSLFVISLL